MRRSLLALLVAGVLASSCTLLTDPSPDPDKLSAMRALPNTVEASAFAPVITDSGIVTRVAFRNTGTARAVVEHGACDLSPVILERSGRVRYADEGIACIAILMRLEIPPGETRELTGGASWEHLRTLGIRLDGAEAQVGLVLNDRRILSPRTRVR